MMRNITRTHRTELLFLSFSLCLQKQSTHPHRLGSEWVTAGAVCEPGAPLPGWTARRCSTVCRLMLPHLDAQRSTSRLRSSPNVPNLLLCPPVSAWRTHTRTADAPLRFLDTQVSCKVAAHPQRYVNCLWNTPTDVRCMFFFCFLHGVGCDGRFLECVAVERPLSILPDFNPSTVVFFSHSSPHRHDVYRQITACRSVFFYPIFVA